MPERRAMIRGLAELLEGELLPLLNGMVLLLPIVLLGIELASRYAIAVTLPDPSPDAVSLDTPPAPRPRVVDAEEEPSTRAIPATGPSVFSDSPLGYGG
jgi:hypothetical protein